MKRQILSIATAMALTAGGAIFAQSTLNTTAPGPSQESKPGQTNNNLQNPGSNMQKPATPTNGQTTGTATTTTTTTAPTDTTTGTMNNNTTGMMNNGTTGTMNNDQTGTGSTTGTMNNGTTGTTGSYNGSTTGSSMDTSGSTSTRSSRLPKTASDLPTVALIGLLALSAFFAVRVYAKRNA